MIAALREFAREHRDPLLALLDRWEAAGRAHLLRSELERRWDEVVAADPSLRGTPLDAFARHANEATFRGPWCLFAVRQGTGSWCYLRIHRDHLVPEEIDAAEFLRFKEHEVAPTEDDLLEIDFAPFERGFPRLSEPASIGNGGAFLNRRLAGLLFREEGEGLELLHRFLALHRLDGQNLLLEQAFPSLGALRAALRAAAAALRRVRAETPFSEVADTLASLGFAPGWGDTAGRVLETQRLLADVLEAPSPEPLEELLARVPMITRVLVVSPHGWFGQAGVLGRPDTGGQVVYVLDQVRALEREMRQRLARQGVSAEPRIVVLTRLIPDADGTTCDQSLEAISGCRGARIVRVPFRSESGEVVRRWISRFALWPYLERFAAEGRQQAAAELRGRPDLVIGNYSDGNLVATLIAQELGVTQCHIAHALEKTKHLFSALYWRDLDPEYHFACQFTADLIGMNAADFVVASTVQEIAGTEREVGQYESYGTFTMPGLYRVLSGCDPFDPRFNVVSPGADEETYFPFTDGARRLASLRPALDALVFGDASEPETRGALRDPGRPLVFSMARLDRIKNLTGLVEWYARSPRLRGLANLLVVGGSLDPGAAADAEEGAQAERLHALFDEHALEGEVRWVARRLDRPLAGELYRTVADRRGVFVQPAWFEAFGLTVIEAMATGLPTFATCHGGPSEIIETGRSGFHVDPADGAAAAESIAEFLERVREDPGEWERISRGAIERVRARYTWTRYAERLLTLTCVYGFWKYLSRLERQETLRYLQMFYKLQFRRLAAAVPG